MGQRQLVSLTPTVNVVPQTDVLIQVTIHDKFDECTILTIVHLLHTVMDCDKLLVMDARRLVEFGSPYQHHLVQEMDAPTYATILAVAEQKDAERKNQ